jgi:Flp pilus assembly protein TadD
MSNMTDPEQDGLVRAGDRVSAAGDPSSAINVYKSALEKEKNPSSRLPLYIKLGEAYMNAHRLDEAKQVFEEALPLDENNEVKRQLGRLYLSAGQSDDAIATFDSIIKRQKDDVHALNGLGVSYDIKGQHSRAQEYYHKALLTHEDDDQVKSNLGLSLAFEGRYDDALKILQPIGESLGATPKQRHNLALVYALSGDRTKAQELYAKDMDDGRAQTNIQALRSVAKPQQTLDELLAQGSKPTAKKKRKVK